MSSILTVTAPFKDLVKVFLSLLVQSEALLEEEAQAVAEEGLGHREHHQSEQLAGPQADQSHQVLTCKMD